MIDLDTIYQGDISSCNSTFLAAFWILTWAYQATHEIDSIRSADLDLDFWVSDSLSVNRE